MGLRAGLPRGGPGAPGGLSTDEAYLLGLLSSADTLFNRPLAAVLAGLPLEIDIILAAREGQGPGGALLATESRLQERAPRRPEEQAAYWVGCAEADALLPGAWLRGLPVSAASCAGAVHSFGGGDFPGPPQPSPGARAGLGTPRRPRVKGAPFPPGRGGEGAAQGPCCVLGCQR